MTVGEHNISEAEVTCTYAGGNRGESKMSFGVGLDRWLTRLFQ